MMEKELKQELAVAAVTAIRNIIARPRWVMLIEVTCPDGEARKGGTAEPGVQVCEGKVGVRGIVDVIDVEHVRGGGDRDGSDMRRRDWDLYNGVGVNERAYEDERARRGSVGRRLDGVVSTPLGGSNALACVGINVRFLDKNDFGVSGVSQIDEA